MKYQEAFNKFNRELLIEVLRRNQWHSINAAKELHIHRNTLLRLAKASGLSPRQIKRGDLKGFEVQQ